VLDRVGFKVGEIDAFEVNEAFAAQALAVIRELDLRSERTNPDGSGISLGHPVGASCGDLRPYRTSPGQPRFTVMKFVLGRVNPSWPEIAESLGSG
jgi:hypothetical protein